jgi:HEPN domain-containing protein
MMRTEERQRKMPERSKDWINQAIKDLKTAEDMAKSGSFEWSCFVAQQAAGKAVKAVFQKLNAVAWGHSVLDLIKILSNKATVSEELVNCARTLDRYYVPHPIPQ